MAAWLRLVSLTLFLVSSAYTIFFRLQFQCSLYTQKKKTLTHRLEACQGELCPS